eukprot:CAMPEP_0169165674 /NCGR_PEP_ID=MMETSP1015-20121227/59545_1 /TAXON_ID=342587 /ORGANISM="Karlodinium micrum, Strain CCMP2283" /LENGTH=651 /DNA_ID=CAMNT_0009238295 /DNA_START=118 /DNA_END=2074 /DNA_ORIENTATION=-
MGVQKDLIEAGDGKTFPTGGDTVELHYIGSLSETGVIFDSSIDRGKPLITQIGTGRVIKGFDIGVLQMSLGEKAILHISSDFAYGAKGWKVDGNSDYVIPPNADLEYEVHLLRTFPTPPARLPPRETPLREPHDRQYDRYDRDFGSSSSFDRDAFRRRAAAKEPAKAAPKKEPEKPRRLWEIPKEERIFNVGTRVQIFGLTSDTGKKLNGKVGEIVEVEEIKGRYQVKLPNDDNPKSVAPDKIRLAGPDARWSSGDLARIVVHPKGDDSEAHPDDGALCYLLRSAILPKKKKDEDSDQPEKPKPKPEDVNWYVDVNGLPLAVKCKYLRVCTQKDDDDPKGILSWSWSSIILVGFCIAVTVIFLLGSGLVVVQVTAARIDQSTAPLGIEVAMLALGTPMFAVVWMVGAIGGGYVLHAPIRDPRVYCLSLHELSSLPYRVCVNCYAPFRNVFNASRIGIADLPGGRTGPKGTEFISFGLAAAAGVAVQGVFPWEIKSTWSTYIHYSGYLVFLVSIYFFMRSAGPLYSPELYVPTVTEEGNEDFSEAVDVATSSKLLQHEFVRKILWVRHDILMRLPPATLIFPLMVRLWESSSKKDRPDKETSVSSPTMRNAMGLAQWLAVLNFAAIFMSYGPEIAVAALLPRPSDDPLGGFS